MHSQFKKSAYCLVVAALVSACSGNSSSTNVATVIDVDPTTQLAQQTLAELGGRSSSSGCGIKFRYP